ncbi:MAG: PTS sugar transporter subunit IIA [Phycisphaerae bacterium]|nr:PTS sugar transporter subunit IIA [Phycisphaerae bacterium]
MKFSDFFCFEAVIPELTTCDRNGVIGELTKALEDAGCINAADTEKIAKAVIKRETEASTGLGKGVAIPHVKHKAVDRVIATIGQSPSGIDFNALDKMPVYSVILLISPVNDPDQHLQAMENVFKHLQQEKFRKFLRQAQSKEQIRDLFKEADEEDVFI